MSQGEPSRQLWLTLVAGPNGSGKTTFAREAAGTQVLAGVTAINPDDLTTAAAAELPDRDPAGANVIGVERAEKAVWRAIAEGASVAVETVLGSDKYVRVVKAARRRGYRIRLIFVALRSPAQSIERVRVRVESGGHDVPTKKITDRWHRSHDQMVELAALVDDVLVYSNQGEAPLLVAERVGHQAPFTIHHAEELPEVTRRLAST